MKARPLGIRILAKRNPDWESKIFVKANNSNKQSLEAIVLGVGKRVEEVKVGDRIIIARFGQYEPPPFDEDKEGKYKDCIIVNEDDALLVIEEENTNG